MEKNKLWLAAGGVLMFLSGVAYADLSEDRYYEAINHSEKAKRLIQAVHASEPAPNTAEKKAGKRAIRALENAQAHAECALLLRADPTATCP